ncbi:hypothetical protein TrLO_g9626 [Triparma laevis f. longispina]|uniref:Endonuclease/exonuclease/phosphatase domain-containing protein n=2 Tax=Triparma laevis TaxID=1534972 RepID=A0A9W7FS91_9STRA|nr:hypothetical protein TrLO_g9626 [Triparma laevis f. longispina]
MSALLRRTTSMITPSNVSPQGTKSIKIMSWNILLPNSDDGWWTFKNYCPETPQSCREWPYRQAKIQEVCETEAASIICFQEAGERSYVTDFAFLEGDGGYVYEVADKGRMRCMTFYKDDEYEKLFSVNKDRCLIMALKHKELSEVIWIINCHLQAGNTNGQRRLRQLHDSLETVRKKAKALNLSEKRCIVCGDFNSDNEGSATQKLLKDGIMEAGFIENGVVISNKNKKQTVGKFLDSYVLAYGDTEPPPTLVAPKLIEYFVAGVEEGQEGLLLTHELVTVLTEVFKFYAASEELVKAEVDVFLTDINLSTERGSEMRFAYKILEEKGSMSVSDFIDLYRAEIKGGKFWGVAHDLVIFAEKFGIEKELLDTVLPQFYHRKVAFDVEAVKDKDLFKARFDYVFHTQDSLELLGVRGLEEGSGGKPMPNRIDPSDHHYLVGEFEIK